MAFAVGKESQAICDRCGFQYYYLDLKKEWNGLFVCPEWYEPKHPQLEPISATSDPEALYDPRPDNDNENTDYVHVFTSTDPVGTNFDPLSATSNLGSVTITT